MTNEVQNPNKQRLKSGKPHDLEERTAQFGEEVIRFVKTLPKQSILMPLANQLIRSATSVGANYMEADGADTKKEFLHRMGICKREAKETRHWLRMLAVAAPEYAQKCRELWKEANELALIFSSITRR